MSEAALFSEEDRDYLNFTLNTRQRIANEMLKKGIPEGDEDRKFLLSAIDGMDRTVLSRARLKADDSANRNNSNMATIVTQLLTRVNVRGVVEANMEENSNRQAPTLEGEFSVSEPVEGETMIGVEDMNYDTFMQSRDKD